MTVVETVDTELLVTSYLRTHPDVAELTDYVATRNRPNLDAGPWVKVTLLADRVSPFTRSLHLTAALLQIDVYAGPPADGAQQEASELARVVRGALHALNGDTPHGVVTLSRPDGLRPLPDDSFEPARERYIVDLDLSSHPRVQA